MFFNVYLFFLHVNELFDNKKLMPEFWSLTFKNHYSEKGA